jgi:hypothetical protein
MWAICGDWKEKIDCCLMVSVMIGEKVRDVKAELLLVDKCLMNVLFGSLLAICSLITLSGAEILLGG